MRHLRNERGAYVLAVAIGSVILTFILVSVTQSQMTSNLQSRSRSKGLMDAQVAIDQLALELKRAYDLAAPAPESNSTSPFPATSTPWAVPSPTGPENVRFYIPSSTFPSEANQICVHRSDGRDIIIFSPFATGGPPSICVRIPDDFFASIEQNEIRIHLKKPSDITVPASKFYSYLQLIRKAAPQEAFAGLFDAYEPGLPAVLPSVPLTNITADADPSFRFRYANFNYTAKNDRFYLGIKFCIKYTNDCTEDEMVRQTYILMKPPLKSQEI